MDELSVEEPTAVARDSVARRTRTVGRFPGAPPSYTKFAKDVFRKFTDTGSGSPSDDKPTAEHGMKKLERREQDSEETFSARLVLLKDGQMVVEFSFAGDKLVWAPLEAVIELADGSRVRAEVDPSRTTTPQTVMAPVMLRLALKVREGMGQPLKVHLKSGTVPLLLEL